MKTTKTGYRISKNGSVNKGTERDCVKSKTDLGKITKVEGTYYFFSRKQGNIYIYLP